MLEYILLGEQMKLLNTKEDFIAFLIAVIINAGIFFGAIYVGSNGGDPVHFVAESVIIITSIFMAIIIALPIFRKINKKING